MKRRWPTPQRRYSGLILLLPYCLISLSSLLFLLLLVTNTVDGERPCAENICQNGGVCRHPDDGGEDFHCECPIGFRGLLCESPTAASGSTSSICNKPCANDAVCELAPTADGGERQSCVCLKGHFGDLCERTDCEIKPCQTGEICLFDAEATRFTCEEDLCVLRRPCKSNATCRPAKGDYFCECPLGFGGKDCETSIPDEKCLRCLNGAECVHVDANRVRCDCASGFAGESCENFLGYCYEGPCGRRGICREFASGFKCSCFPPYHGINCELNGDEIGSENSTQSTSVNRTAQSDAKMCGTHGKPALLDEGKVGCTCDDDYTGEHCDVRVSSSAGHFPEPPTALPTTNSPAIGGVTDIQHPVLKCDALKCGHGEICRVRQRFDAAIGADVNEDAECDCPPGRTGDGCMTASTVTLFAESAVLIDRPRRLSTAVGENSSGDYQLEFSFRTTLASVVLASGESIFGADDFILSLRDGRLWLNFSSGAAGLSSSSIPLALDLAGAGALNDAQWHRVRFVNTLRDGCLVEVEDQEKYRVLWRRSLGVARPLQRIFTTRFGGKGDKNAFFVGCLRDVKIDSQRVDLSAQTRSVGLVPGCMRIEQCHDGNVTANGADGADSSAQCANGGRCVDLWSEFRCECKRPFLAPRCQHAVSEVTFGHGKRESAAEFALSSDEAERIRDSADISFFVRTNTAPATLFYLGETPTTAVDAPPTFLSAQLREDGALEVTMRFGAGQPLRNHTKQSLNDNQRHFVRVTRSPSNVTVFVDDVLSAQIPLGRPFQAILAVDILLLGAIPPSIAPSGNSTFSGFLRGTLQDVRVNERLVAIVGADGGALSLSSAANGSGDMPPLSTFGRQTRTDNLLQGTVSDDVCAAIKPCLNDGHCVNTFNDFRCECAAGWIGTRCAERDHCAASPCRASAACVNVGGGYVCLAPATFAPTSLAVFALTAAPHDNSAQLQQRNTNLTFELRTRSIGPTGVFRLESNDESLRIDVDKSGALLVAYRNASFAKAIVVGDASNKSGIPVSDGDWHAVVLRDADDAESSDGLSIHIDGGDEGIELALPVSLQRLIRRANVSLHIGQHDAEHVNSFKGCLQNMLLSGLPPLSFFEGSEGAGGFNANISSARFVLTRSESVRAGHCYSDQVCFEGAANECRNGAACRDVFNARRCDCPVGFSGPLCEVNIDDCALAAAEATDAKCGPNGICVDGIANYTCICLPGFTGARCETPTPNECETRYKGACLNGGKCERDVTGDYRCACPPNFLGQYCQTSRNTKCSRAPCKNNAKCTPTESGGFTCQCPAGFAGALCDLEINAGDPCRQKPCLNGGRCMSMPTASQRQRTGAVTFPRFAANAFTCECRAEFAGARCERFVDVCARSTIVDGVIGIDKNRTPPNASLCYNNAHCENIFGGHVCRCASGWRGADCTIDVDECVETAPCRNGGRCRNTPGSFQCDCSPFYFGELCQIQGACARQPCRNGAVCEQISAENHICQCAPGYRGNSCEEEIDFCASKPCLNGAKCRRVVAGFECTCAPGFNGKTCENDIDECALAPNACANNGTCIDRVNAFECDCTGTGYQGPQCLDDVDECAQLPTKRDQRATTDDDGDYRDVAGGEDEPSWPIEHPKFIGKSHANTSLSSKCVHGVCTNLPGSYRCDCEPGYIGERCQMANPCLPEPRTNRVLHACTHGKCVRPTVVRQPSGREVTQHDCECDPGYGGAQCTFLEQAKKPLAIGFILGPFAVLLVILCAFGTMLFLLVVRKKRATQGTYSPSTQEMTGAVRPTMPIHAHHAATGAMITKSGTTQRRISPKPRKKNTAASISAHLNNNNGF